MTSSLSVKMTMSLPDNIQKGGSCTRFIVVYKTLFQDILNEPITQDMNMGIILSRLTSNKLVTFPFISTHHLSKDNKLPQRGQTTGKAGDMFALPMKRLSNLLEATKKYQVLLPKI